VRTSRAAAIATACVLVAALLTAAPAAADAVRWSHLDGRDSGKLASGLSSSVAGSNLKRTGDLTPESWWGNDSSWNRYAYALDNPLRYLDPDGLDEIQWDEKTTAEVYTGDVLVIGEKNSDGGATATHVATYQQVGSGGKPLGYEHTSARNTDLSNFPTMDQTTNPDNTGARHELVDLTQETVNAELNPYSPANGAILMGVVPANASVSPRDLAVAAGTMNSFYGAQQCIDFAWRLNMAAGTHLNVNHPLFSNPLLTDFAAAVDTSRVKSN